MTLDILIDDTPQAHPIYSAGGTCANILSALEFLGWAAVPVGRLGKDPAGDRILKDLHRQGVDTSFIIVDPSVSSPRIVQLIEYRQSVASHRFLTKCPKCRRFLPGYRPLTLDMVREVVDRLPSPSVFVFDRPSPAVLALAREMKARGALIFFEPNTVKEVEGLRKGAAISHIVKYSHQRVGVHFSDGRGIRTLTNEVAPYVEIETLGSEGVRYRSAHEKPWRILESFRTDHVRDTAGAGDWFSAGFLYRLCSDGDAPTQLRASEIGEAVRFAQALAAIKCRYLGARGLISQGRDTDIFALISAVMAHGQVPAEDSHRYSYNVTEVHDPFVCSLCFQPMSRSMSVV